MQKWEYLQDWHSYDKSSLVTWLNEKGQKGWEMVCATGRIHTSEGYIFKRVIK